MGCWNKLWKKDKVSPGETENWEQLVYDSDEVDFRDEEQRSRYVLGCLDQIAEADRETKELTGEYALVTSYLTDAEEIIADRYGNITGGNNPVLKDVNGDLYVRKNDEKGDGFNWNKDESGNIILEISETNSEKFTVHSSGHIITIVNDNSLWKVDSIN